jgi:hypothetical protein
MSKIPNQFEELLEYEPKRPSRRDWFNWWSGRRGTSYYNGDNEPIDRSTYERLLKKYVLFQKQMAQQKINQKIWNKMSEEQKKTWMEENGLPWFYEDKPNYQIGTNMLYERKY